jgi:hypothetical protein
MLLTCGRTPHQAGESSANVVRHCLANVEEDSMYTVVPRCFRRNFEKETIPHGILTAGCPHKPSSDAIAVLCGKCSIKRSEIREPVAILLDDCSNYVLFGREITVQLLNGDSGLLCDERNTGPMKAVLNEQSTRDLFDVLPAQFGTRQARTLDNRH